MKRTIIYIILMLIVFNGLALAQSYYVETFDDYQITTYNKVYDSLQEIDSDGVPENLFSLFGVGGNPGNYTETGILLSNVFSGYVNELGFNLTASSLNADNLDLEVDITVCETNDNDLDTGSDLFNQCIGGTETLIVDDFPLSDRWGAVTSGQYKTIPLDTPYNFDSIKKYIFILQTVDSNLNPAYTNKYYSGQTDFNTPSFFHYKRQINGAYSRFTAIPSFDLYASDWDNANFIEQANLTCNVGSYPECKVCVGSGCNGNGFFALGVEAGNQYLNLYTDQNSFGNYERVSLRAILDESGYTLMDNSSLSFNIRVNNVEWADVATLGFEKRNYYAGLGINSITDNIAHIGGLDTTVENNFTQLRSIYQFTTSPYSFPINSECNVTTGNWEAVTIYYTKSGANIINTKTYINGDLCQDYNFTSAIAGGELSIVFDDRGIFDIDIDEIAYYEYFSSPNYDLDAESLLFCPYSNCLFYDDFTSYGDFGDVAEGEWTFQTQNAIVFDDKLFFNTSEAFPIIEHELLDNDFTEVVGIVEFNINGSPTPQSLEDDFIVYEIETQCNFGTPVYSYKVVMIRDDDFSGTENRTVINVYSIQDAKPNILGTFTVDNGDYFVIKNTFDLEQQVAFLNILRKIDIIDGYEPDLNYRQELFSVCNEVTNVHVRRRTETTQQIYFAGIERIFYYGVIDELLDDEGYTYQNESDQISISEALVKKDVGDILHNTALTLGFRSTATKMLFWVVIIAFFIFLVMQGESSSSIKTLSVIFILVSMMVVGHYLEFIPTIVFILLIFTLTVSGAFLLSRAFGEGVS